MRGLSAPLRKIQKALKVGLAMCTFPEAIDVLVEGGDNQARLKKCCIVIEETALKEGLLPEHILSLAELVASRKTNSVILSRVVRSLIPRTSVPSSAVLQLLGSQKGQTLSLQLLIIRWIVLIYDIIDNKADVHAIYGIIFYYLQNDELRPVICQLLCYMTRRCDVTHFRVQQLIELARHVEPSKGAEKGLSALLILYHTYCPNMLTVPLSHNRNKKLWFRPFEKQLAANIMRVQKERHSDDSHQSAMATDEQIMKRLTAAPPPLKKSRKQCMMVVPRSLSSSGDKEKMTIEAVNSHQELCENITNIEFPSQVASVLNSHHLMHMFSMSIEPSAAIRFTYWLEHNLGYELDSYTPGSTNVGLQLLLQQLHTLTQFIQEPIPTVESFLHILLEEWNGDDYRHEIMNLLSHISLQPFDDFEKDYLQPIKKHFISKDRDFKCQFLRCMSQLLKNWALFEWHRHQKKMSSDSNTIHRVSLFSSYFEEEVDDFNPLVTIGLFIKYIDHLIVIALEQEKWDALVYHAAMRFYEVVADLSQVYGVPHLSLPSPSILYTGLLGCSPVFISWACTHLVKVKNSLSGLRKNERDLQLTQTFNTLVLDFSNALWRNMIFKKSNSKTGDYPTLAFDLPREQLVECDISQPHKRLNLVHHPAMIGLVLQFFIETQEADILDQLLPSAIWQETRFKQVYLQFLDRQHLPGITDFIRTFIHTN